MNQDSLEQLRALRNKALDRLAEVVIAARKLEESTPTAVYAIYADEMIKRQATALSLVKAVKELWPEMAETL
jgi:hypothetical protein